MRTPVKVVLLTFAALAVVYLLFTVVFPWVDRTFVTDPVMGARAGWSAFASQR